MDVVNNISGEYSLARVNFSDQILVSEPKFYRCVDWFQNYSAEVNNPEESHLLFSLVRNSDSAVCIILPCVIKNDRKGFMRRTVLRAMSNYYTPNYMPLYESEDAKKHLKELLELLIAEVNPDFVEFSPLRLTSQLYTELESVLREKKYSVFSQTSFVNWTTDIATSFEDYMASRSSRLKNTIKRKEKKTVKNYALTCKIESGKENIVQAIEHYEQVYSNSWKPQEVFKGFIPGLIKLLAKRDELRLGILYLDDVPVATHLWAVSDSVAYIYKLAYSEEYKEYSPGSILMLRMLQHVIEVDQVNKIDFVSGDDSYKTDWMTDKAMMQSLRAYNRGSLSGVYSIGSRFIRTTANNLKSRFLVH